MEDRMGRKLSTKQVFKKVLNRLLNIWLDFELLLLNIVSNLVPFHSIRKLVFRLAGVKIEKGSFVHMGSRFYFPPGVTIGKGTIVGDHCFLDGRATLVIGNYVDIASQVLIYNSEHDIISEGFDPVEERVEIGDYVFIGPGAIIQPGVKIGKGAVVAAGAVVANDIPEFEVWGGVPARFIKKREIKDPHYRLGRARLFQ